MNDIASTPRPGPGRFGIGQPVPRTEDPVLLRGEGRFTDDIPAPGQAHIVMLRSDVAHGEIRSVDTTAARAMPGVLGIWTGRDLEQAGYRWNESWLDQTGRDGSRYRQTARMVIATDRVRHMGEIVACVLAETADQARDAVAEIAVDIASLPAVVDMTAALAPGAPQIHADIPGNLVLDFLHGDPAATEAAFAAAAHVGRVDLEDSRIIVNPMEPRGCLALHDPETGRFTLHTQSQGVFGLRREICQIMGLAPDRLRVCTGHVGGSFGMRILPFPEQICALHAARETGRPVRFLEDRTTSFLSDTHGRAGRYSGELALDAEGRMLALRVRGIGDMGAYLTAVGLLPPTLNMVLNLGGQYRLPCMEVAVQCGLTNTVPVGAYRGAGRQMANYLMERLIDATAATAGIDRVALRRLNQLRPDELPRAAPSGVTCDCGDFGAVTERALAAADVAGFAARRAASAAAGRLRGLGIGCYLEATARATAELGRIRFDDDGGVTFITGTLDFGQGHHTTFAQILAQKLGLPFESIRVLQGDSDEIRFGGGTGGSRSVIASGTAAIEAADEVISRAFLLARWALGSGANDIIFRDGRVMAEGSGAGIGLIELAQRLRAARALPPGAAGSLPPGLPDTLDTELVTQGPGMAFPYGCHVCELEIDPETGAAAVLRYVMANDFGTVINPLLLDGQCHGGVAQGIGQCLTEQVVFDGAGQLLSGSLSDYALPRADAMPHFTALHHAIPTANNPLGAKGAGESGCAGSIPAVMNALLDALAPLGVRALDMPATPLRLWQAIRAAAPR